MTASDAIVRDYAGPCIDLIPRCRVVEVTRGGRVETVAMPTSEDTNKETCPTTKLI